MSYTLNRQLLQHSAGARKYKQRGSQQATRHQKLPLYTNIGCAHCPFPTAPSPPCIGTLRSTTRRDSTRAANRDHSQGRTDGTAPGHNSLHAFESRPHLLELLPRDRFGRLGIDQLNEQCFLLHGGLVFGSQHTLRGERATSFAENAGRGLRGLLRRD